MPTFEYQAQNASGESVRGVVIGASLDHAARDLAAKGFTVSQIGLSSSIGDPLAHVAPPPAASGLTGAVAAGAARREQAVAAEVLSEPIPSGITEQRSYISTNISGPLVGQVPLTALSFFFRQLATMLHAGVPYVQSLDTLSRQTKSPKLAEIVTELRDHVNAGRQMSDGLQRYPEVFSTVVLSLIRAGEKGGFIDQSLTQVADYLDREIVLRNLYRRVTFYPKIQIGASIIIIIGANAVIASINVKAQQLSSPLTSLSTWMWLAPLLVGLFLFFRVGLANSRIRYNWDTVFTNLPGFGKIMRELAMARFGRAFGALYKAGVPMTEAMKMSADSCGNEFLRTRMYPAARHLESGDGVTDTLRATDAFDPIVLDMISTGETTGNLDHMLTKMSEFYEDEAATKSTQLGHVTGVVVGLLVAIYIGSIIIGFYTGNASQMSSATAE